MNGVRKPTAKMARLSLAGTRRLDRCLDVVLQVLGDGRRRWLESRFVELSMGVLISVAMMMVLVVGVDAQFDGYDGRPRPPGMSDEPTRLLDTNAQVNFSGKPAECIWYGWNNVLLLPDDHNCTDNLWLILKFYYKRSGGGSALEAFRYYFESDDDTATVEHNCTIGCFNLLLSVPQAQPRAPPPLILTPPLPQAAHAPSPFPNPPSSGPSSTPHAPGSSAPAPRTSCLSPSSKSQVGLIAGVCSAVLGGLLIAGLLLLFCCVKRRRKLSGSPFGLSPDTTASRPYTFRELSTMTKSFSRSELLSSSGGFGEVFRGTPPSGTGKLVAVKRIRREKEHAQASFLAEATSLRQIRHRNLLQLRGWCEAREGLFLVYDYMRNGSLDKWIHGGTEPLPWSVRRTVLAGVAAGLVYLHEGWVQCVLHRDIKPSNVLLDADWNPYLGDFGLARLVDHEKLDKTTLPAGTLGYMAPEMHYTGKATKETDVYAFGMLILEVVSGRRPFGGADQDFLLLDSVWRAHEAGSISQVVDVRLQGSSSTEEMAALLQVGLLCCVANPIERPSIRVAGHWLQLLEAGTPELIPALPASQPVAPPRYVSVLVTSSLDRDTSTSDSTSSSTPSGVQITNPR